MDLTKVSCPVCRVQGAAAPSRCPDARGLSEACGWPGAEDSEVATSLSCSGGGSPPPCIPPASWQPGPRESDTQMHPNFWQHLVEEVVSHPFQDRHLDIFMKGGGRVLRQNNSWQPLESSFCGQSPKRVNPRIVRL